MYYLYKIISYLLGFFIQYQNIEEEIEDAEPCKKRYIWVHTASVGEVKTVAGLMEVFLEKGNGPILLSVFTSSGYRTAEATWSKRIKLVRFPLDNVRKLRSIVSTFPPSAIIIAETEIWPNLILIAKRNNIPLFLINARISEESFRRYKLFKRQIGSLLRNFQCIITQSEEDRRRFCLLGVDEKKLFRESSLKHNVVTTQDKGLDVSSLGFTGEKPLVVMGSVREKEEDIVIKALLDIKKRRIPVNFVIAPRHLERVGHIQEKLKTKDIPFALRTHPDRMQSVMILDTIGELCMFYNIADIAFVGGTLVDYGGHNLAEPAYFKLPVVFGPYVSNVKEIAKGLLQQRGGICVRNSQELSQSLEYLIKNQNIRKRIGNNAYRLIQLKADTANRIYTIIESYLTNKNLPLSL